MFVVERYLPSRQLAQDFTRMYIPHELKLAVWGDKADRSITIELA